MINNKAKGRKFKIENVKNDFKIDMFQRNKKF